MVVQPIPEGYEHPIPSLTIDGAAEAIDFYKRVFGAEERGRMDMPDGKVAHAEVAIGGSLIMLADPFPQGDRQSPKDVGGRSSGVFLYVEDVDAVVQGAVDAGAEVTLPVEDQFWGDRYGKIVDPFGHEWELATHKEDLSPEEVERRGREAMASMGG